MATPMGLPGLSVGLRHTRGSHRPQASHFGRTSDGKEVLRESCTRSENESSQDDFVSGRTEHGQGLVEYGLILVLIAIVAIVSLIFLGGTLSNMISNVGSSV